MLWHLGKGSMKLPIFVGMTLLAASAWGQGNPSSGHGAPSFNCAINDQYNDLDSGLAWKCGPTANTWKPNPQSLPWVTPTSGNCPVGNGVTFVSSPCGSGGGSSVTLENTYSAPGSFTFAHNLNSLYPLVTCYTSTGPATWTAASVDANDTSITVPAAGTYICSFSPGGTLASSFSVATSPTSQTFEPTMTGTQHPTFTVNQSITGSYSGTATYSTTGLASGMTGVFSPTTITGAGSNTLTLSFPFSQTPATTSFNATGNDGTNSHSANPSITVGTINSGLVECWPMTDGSGSSFADGCGTSNTETLSTGSLTWASNAGLPGTTATFSSTAVAQGTNQTATNFNGSTPFSVSTWVKLADISAYHAIASTLQLSSNDQGWEVAGGGGDGFSIFLINNLSAFNHIQVFCTAVPTANTLYNVVWTYDGSKTAAGVIIYVNGTPCAVTVGENSLTGAISSTQNVALGGRVDNSEPLNGIEAYTRIYNRVLSQTDVTNYYGAGPR